MGIFSFIKKDKKRDRDPFAPGKQGKQSSSPWQYAQNGHHRTAWTVLDAPTFASADLLAQFPPNVLERIFAHLCPHSQDESYEACEQSAPEDTCMLCDLRDLAHCAQVCKKWRDEARKLMYYSVRIDSVHYCEREAFLAEARKRRTRFDRNGEPEDTPRARLKLLCRTLREDPTRLGARVRFLKTPYMLREAAQADLARTIAVLPNLLYVDLPEGLFSDDPSYATLRLEVEARCPHLQKMSYRGGAERSLARLAQGNIWKELQVLEISKINMDPAVLRRALGALHSLHALKVTDSKGFIDDVFAYDETLPPFPPLEQLVITRCSGITASGLVEYLSDPDVRQTLQVLSLNKTGVELPTLHEVVSTASCLKTLVVQARVDHPFKSGPYTQRLSSWSLETLRYEITSDPQASPYSGVSKTYYTYLASSILGGGLQNLRAVYVIDEDFPEQLQGLPPPPAPPLAPRAPFANNRRPSSSGSMGGGMSTSPRSHNSHLSPHGNSVSLQPPSLPFAPPPALGGGGMPASNRFSSNNPFAGTQALTHTLEVFTKKDEAMNWSFIKIRPTAVLGGGLSGGGGASSYGAGSYGAGSYGAGGYGSSPSNRLSVMSTGAGSMVGHNRVNSGSSDRPVSSYGLGADMLGAGWNTPGARRSVMVGGAGGFVAVPTPEPAAGGLHPTASGGEEDELWPRPKSSGGDQKGDRDIWR